MTKRIGRRPGFLKDLLSKEQIEALETVIDAPLSEDEQAALEGDETDALGIWIGKTPPNRES